MNQVFQIIQQFFNFFSAPDPLTISDNSDANITYIGTAPWGALTSDPKWTITKTTANCTVTTVGGVNTISAVGSGTQTITQRASDRSNSIWDNHTSVVYNTTA